jgi:hypothetical protein
VKRTSFAILTLPVLFLFFIACTRIDTTQLGDGLIPAVDNVHTFDVTLDVTTDNFLLPDSLRVISSDALPVGEIFDDPEFGRTVSNLYFTIYPSTANGRPNYPFYNKDSITSVDSVVLQLSFKGIYGDSTSVETFRVEEIAQSSGFKDSAYYLGTSNFTTAGILGTKVVDFTTLNDTNIVIRKDTSKRVNVLRIKLDNSFGTRLTNYDTTTTINGAYRSDSIFSTLVRGLAVTIDSNKAGNKALAYFSVGDTATQLLVYYRAKRNGTIDTAVAQFYNSGSKNVSGLNLAVSGQASTIRRTPQHGYATYLSNGNPSDDRVYIQSTPGSYALITIPGLDTMQNKVIHRAELIMPRVASPGDNTYGLPELLFLDMISTNKDSAYTIQNDFLVANSGPNFASFGGIIRASDQTYRFTVTRHVQGIVTRHEPNFKLRVYAPFVTVPWYIPPGSFSTSGVSRVAIPVSSRLGAGRVVLYGGAEADLTKKMRLYIVYSKI